MTDQKNDTKKPSPSRQQSIGANGNEDKEYVQKFKKPGSDDKKPAEDADAPPGSARVSTEDDKKQEKKLP